MRRRRQKNTLLPKMLGVAVLLNAILLPLLAQLGVFKGIKGGQHLTPVQLVQAPPPPPKPKEAARKAHPRVAHRAQPSRRAAPREAARPALSHPNLIAGAPGKGAGGGPAVNPVGTGAAGQLPTVAPTPTVTPATPAAPRRRRSRSHPPLQRPSRPPHRPRRPRRTSRCWSRPQSSAVWSRRCRPTWPTKPCRRPSGPSSPSAPTARQQ